MSKHYYLAYGMNTDPAAMDYDSHCKPIGAATLEGYHLEFEYFATIEPGGSMQGVLWEIDDETLYYLDNREGYPNYYNRRVVNVFHETETYGAIVYFMTDRYISASVDKSPPQHYVDRLTIGYTQFGIPLTQIEEALALA
jgi:gamma-glutamylcyclotransferase (GGCT)/AIG2-like uncharacterized protein YtfP